MTLEEENIDQTNKLEELSQSDFEIVSGEPDIIGWNVKTNLGKKIGEVDDLLFDPQSRNVRYFVLDMEDNDLDLEVERKVLIPIGVANLHNEDDEVIIPGISVDMLADLPPYNAIALLTSNEEMEIREIFEGGSTAPYEHPQFYAHDHFNEDKFYTRGRIADEFTSVSSAAENPSVKAAREEKASRIIAKINHKDIAPS